MGISEESEALLPTFNSSFPATGDIESDDCKFEEFSMDTSERMRLYQNSDEETGCSISTRLEKRLLIILVIIVTVGVGLCIGIISKAKGESNGQSSNICFSPQCILTASDLLQSMDLKQKPCDDFYSFVCSNWIKNEHLDGETTTQFSKLNRIIDLRIKELLEASHPNSSEHEKKTRIFYHSCMDTDTREDTGTKVLKEDLKNFGGWPLIDEKWEASKFNWSDLLIKFFENGYLSNTLLGFGVDLDIKNTSTSLISINQPSVGLSNKKYYRLSKSKVVDRYKNLILDLAINLNPDLDKKAAAKDIDQAFEIEKQLGNAPKERNVKDPDSFYNIMTLKEIEKLAPKIPFRHLLKNLLPPDTKLEKDQRIMIAFPESLETLNKILTELDNDKGKKALANYMLYRAVLFAAENLQLDLLFLCDTIFHRSSRRNLWNICVNRAMVFFDKSLTVTYAERYMDATKKSLAEKLFQDIQSALSDDIKEAKWLDKETKETALLKVKKSRSAIAYRDEIFDEKKLDEYYSPIQVGEDHFVNVKSAHAFKNKQRMLGLNTRRERFSWSDMSNLLVANAYYVPIDNSITIPIGIMHEIFFSPGRPNYMNYGSLGSMLGHEYTHAFDNSGSLFDEEGNYRMWWTNESWVNYQEKTQCYKDQYDKYYETQVESFVNGTLTLGENIADNGGLLTVYEAYQKQLARIGKEKQLPGLQFSERQMFWVAYASIWCRKQTDHNLQYTIEHNVHAPARFRVNGALSNIKQFSEDFKCELGSNLNPITKCSLWK